MNVQDGSTASSAGTGAPIGSHNPTLGSTNPNSVTSTTKINAVAQRLVATTVINNYANNPRTYSEMVKINATALFALFLNILLPLAFDVHRAIGLNSSSGNFNAMVTEYASSYARSAVIATHGVLFNKALRIASSGSDLFNGYPVLSAVVFPQYVTAIINSFGPVTLKNPGHFQLVPFLDLTECLNTYAGQNIERNVGMISNAMSRERTIGMTTVDPLNNTSSNWWTYFLSSTRSGGVPSLRLFSPVPFDDTEVALQPALAFSNRTILATSDPASAVLSTSDWFDFPAPPRETDFPAAVFEPPSFNKHFPAYFSTVEHHPNASPRLDEC